MYYELMMYYELISLVDNYNGLLKGRKIFPSFSILGSTTNLMENRPN